MTVRYGAVHADWLGYATVRLEGEMGAVIYTDPGRHGVLDGYDACDGDVVLVTHGDHYEPDGIRRVAHEDAIVIVHESIDAREIGHTSEQPEDLPYEVERVGADESFVLGPLDLFTTPAYNEHGGPRTDERDAPFHPEGEGCGYGITVDGVTAFWPGDTDALAVHEDLEVDLFMPPIGGAVTMDRREAAALAETMRPGLVLPIHYDTVEALETDAEAFVVDVARRRVPVVLDEDREDAVRRSL